MLHYSLDHFCPEATCLLRGPVPPFSGHLYSFSFYLPTMQYSGDGEAGIVLIQCPLNVQGEFPACGNDV